MSISLLPWKHANYLVVGMLFYRDNVGIASASRLLYLSLLNGNHTFCFNYTS